MMISLNRPTVFMLAYINDKQLLKTLNYALQRLADDTDFYHAYIHSIMQGWSLVNCCCIISYPTSEMVTSQ